MANLALSACARWPSYPGRAEIQYTSEMNDKEGQFRTGVQLGKQVTYGNNCLVVVNTDLLMEEKHPHFAVLECSHQAPAACD